MPRRKSAPEVERIEPLTGDVLTSDEPAEPPSLLSRLRSRWEGRGGGKSSRRSKAKAPAGHPTQDEIAGLVAEGNFTLAVASYRDRLTPLEQQRLALGLGHYCEQSERARLWLYRALQASAGFSLFSIAVSLAIPRFIRHGLLPPEIAPRVQGFCDVFQLREALGLEPADALAPGEAELLEAMGRMAQGPIPVVNADMAGVV